MQQLLFAVFPAIDLSFHTRPSAVLGTVHFGLLAERTGNYPAVLAITVVVVALTLAGLALLGREAKGQAMTAA